MFQKINLNLGQLDLVRLKGEPMEKYGPKLAKLTNHTIKDFDYFMELHKGKVEFAVMPSCAWYTEIEGTGSINPHIDPLDVLALNYYIQTGNCTTTFYEVPAGSNLNFVTGRQEFDEQDSTRTVKGILDPGLLNVIGEFTAAPGDAYLMRTDILHSVSTPNAVRKFISYRWSGNQYSFDQVLAGITLL